MAQALSNSKWADRLTRPKACEYLLEEHGIRRAPTTLMKLAWKGGGPKFIKIGSSQVLYPRAELDAWAKAITSAPVAKASDLKKRGLNHEHGL
jgi:predicted DNA-binding transcriptional regulator AlpA